jgi:hypothetical protein
VIAKVSAEGIISVLYIEHHGCLTRIKGVAFVFELFVIACPASYEAPRLRVGHNSAIGSAIYHVDRRISHSRYKADSRRVTRRFVPASRFLDPSMYVVRQEHDAGLLLCAALKAA